MVLLVIWSVDTEKLQQVRLSVSLDSRGSFDVGSFVEKGYDITRITPSSNFMLDMATCIE